MVKAFGRCGCNAAVMAVASDLKVELTGTNKIMDLAAAFDSDLKSCVRFCPYQNGHLENKCMTNENKLRCCCMSLPQLSEHKWEIMNGKPCFE